MVTTPLIWPLDCSSNSTEVAGNTYQSAHCTMEHSEKGAVCDSMITLRCNPCEADKVNNRAQQSLGC